MKGIYSIKRRSLASRKLGIEIMVAGYETDNTWGCLPVLVYSIVATVFSVGVNHASGFKHNCASSNISYGLRGLHASVVRVVAGQVSLNLNST